MPPVYPVYILDHDESSFQEAARPADLLYYEEPDIRDDLYEGWDSTGRHFVLIWDGGPRISFSSPPNPQDSLARFSAAISRYEAGCAQVGIVFPDAAPRKPHSGQLCDPRKLRRVVEKLADLHGSGLP